MLAGVIALGVQTWGTDIGALRRYWSAADRLGYARVTYGDGLWSFTHNGWTMLAALAAVTRRVRIGPAVTCAFDPSSHHPSWLAKRAVAVDQLSGGRLDLRLGVGATDAATAAAWASHGIPYPSPARRIARLEEAVEIVRALWRGVPVTRAGSAVTLSGARLGPRPAQRPGPPVWIAAMGPRARALAARRADGWEASYVTPDEFAALWADVGRRLTAAGRAPSTLRRSVEIDVALTRSAAGAARAVAAFCAARAIERGHPLAATVLAGGPDAVAGRIVEYARAGATDLMLGFTDFPSTRMLEAFAADVRPRIAALAGRRRATRPAALSRPAPRRSATPRAT
jgi:alkanesulfonate monooxygenase SsuD/methylene tetrahydromethanopterin reductase-like flavin-dependent oxidoreductase (luciferase family)